MSPPDSRFDGNCGMFAIALADAALRAGRSVRFVLAHDAHNDESFHQGAFYLYHVAVEVDGILCDARGKISREEDLLSFLPPPIPAARVDRFPPGEKVLFLIRRRTKWTVSYEKYSDEARRLLATLA